MKQEALLLYSHLQRLTATEDPLTLNQELIQFISNKKTITYIYTQWLQPSIV